MPKDSRVVHQMVHPCDPCEFCHKGRKCRLGGDTDNPPETMQACKLLQAEVGRKMHLGARLVAEARQARAQR